MSISIVEGLEYDRRREAAKAELVERAEHIRKIWDCATKHLIEHVIIIGRNLVEAREACPHGYWLPWLKREFNWSQSTADRFIQIYRAQDKLPNVGNFNFPLSAQYLLAAPSTPPEARQEIKERVESGERVSVAEVKEAIAKTKAKRDDKTVASPEISLDQRKAEMAALDTTAEEYTAVEVDPTPKEIQSEHYLDEFGIACRDLFNTYLPKLTKDDQERAWLVVHDTWKKAKAA